jgi:hypothetical protein
MKRNKFTSMNLEKGRMNFLVKFIAWLMKSQFCFIFSRANELKI